MPISSLIGQSTGPNAHPSPSRAVWVSIMCAAIALLGCTTAQDTPYTQGGRAAQVAVPANGADLFAANCTVCHGTNGQGQPDWHKPNDQGFLPPPPLNGDGHTWHHPDGLLYQIVSEGGATLEDPAVPGFKSAMPAFGDKLTHDEVIAVLEHVKSLWAGKEKLGFQITESQALVSQDNPYPATAPPNPRSGDQSSEPASLLQTIAPTPMSENTAPPPTYTRRPSPTKPSAGERAPSIPFQARTLDGSTFELSQTFGTPTLIAFWAPW